MVLAVQLFAYLFSLWPWRTGILWIKSVRLYLFIYGIRMHLQENARKNLLVLVTVIHIWIFKCRYLCKPNLLQLTLDSSGISFFFFSIRHPLDTTDNSLILWNISVITRIITSFSFELPSFPKPSVNLYPSFS